MRRGWTACLYVLAILTVLALLPLPAARAKIVFPDGKEYFMDERYLEYTAGQPLTLKLDSVPYSTTGKAIRYEWKYHEYTGGDPIFTPIATTSEPSLTFTPLASDHGRELEVDVFEEGTEHDSVGGFVSVLLDRAREYPQLPKEGKSVNAGLTTNYAWARASSCRFPRQSRATAAKRWSTIGIGAVIIVVKFTKQPQLPR